MTNQPSSFTTHLSMMGNEALLRRCSVAFLCSHRVPDEAFAPIRKWVRSLSPERDCVLVGALAGIERFVVRLLVERGVPVIVALAEALPSNIQDVSIMIPDIKLSQTLGEGRLLVVSNNSDKEDASATTENARQRNLWMLDYAPRIVVGYVTPKGQLYQQLYHCRKQHGLFDLNVLCKTKSISNTL